MTLLKKLLAALAVMTLLTGLAACGDDDDDDDVAADIEEADDEGAEDEGAEEQAEVDDAKAAFCADLDDASGGEDEPIENVEASRDTAVAAQTATETQEQFDAVQLLVDFSNAVIDGDDGDGVITGEEIAAAAEQFPTLEDALALASEWCAAG